MTTPLQHAAATTATCRFAVQAAVALSWLLFPGLLGWLANEVTAAEYYVSNRASDANDGRSAETAWRTIGRVNAAPLEPGDVILLRRGDQWREQLVPHSGSEQGHVTYGAYGSGEKPLLLGSVEKNRPEDWKHEGNNIWSTTGPTVFPCDVGNIIFDGEASCGVKVWNQSDLKSQGDYWYDEDAHVLKLYSTESPASDYSDIECALRRHIIDQSGAGYVIYEDLALKYGAAHGIGGGGTHHVIVRDCDFCYIGGGDQHGGQRTVRYGNGVEFWGNAHDHLVERCRLWEIYDAALTNQNNGPHVKQRNICYRDNLIINCEYSFEYWNRPENSLTEKIRFENNTCLNAGYGWGHTQRPDPSGRHLCFYTSPAPARNIAIRGNIFCEAKTNAFYAPTWSKDAVKALDMDNNRWYQSEGIMIRLEGASYSMAQFPDYQSQLGIEPNSTTGKPSVVDKTYEARYLPEARITVDGVINEPEWNKANVETGFCFPWKKTVPPRTEFRAVCDQKHFYFAFRVHDEDIVAVENFRSETDAVVEDRVELLFSLDEALKQYYCMEMDSRGRFLDFKASYYRKFDFTWDFPGLRVAASPLKTGYCVEGSIPLASFEALGFPSLKAGEKIKFGIFRAEFSHGDGPEPVENWISWIDPRTKEPDFHVPSAFGYLRLVK